MGLALFSLLTTLLRISRFFIEPILKLIYRDSGYVRPPSDPVLTYAIEEVADKIRSQQLKCETLIERYIERIKDVNPLINAVVEDRFEEALREAREVDLLCQGGGAEKLPLLGVPFSVKQTIAVKGLRNTISSLHQPADGKHLDDAEVVKRLKAAGAIPLLISNTPEASFGWETYNKLHGRTRNPFKLSRSAGGSSGGEGALLGSDCCVFGLGSDTAGSIRLPCYFNGVFGHKPTPGIVPKTLMVPSFESDNWHKYTVLGPMAKSARDLRLLMRVLTKNSSDLNLDSTVDVEKVKILFSKSLEPRVILADVDPQIQDAIGRVVKHLAQKSEVKSFNARAFSGLPEAMAARIICSVGFPNFLQRQPQYLKTHQNMEEATFASLVWEMFKFPFRLSKFTLSLIYFESLRRINGGLFCRRKKWSKVADQMETQILSLLGQDTVLILPTFPSASVVHFSMFFRATDATYMTISNAFGLPCTQVPIGFTKEGLPIGLQVIGGPNMDRLTLAVAQEIEDFVNFSEMKKLIKD